MSEIVAEPNFWKKCSSCKKPINYKTLYWVCNVSTCNRKRTGLHFCEVSCWDAHIPMMNHRESWAEERHAPSKEDWIKTIAGQDEPKRRERKPAPALPSEVAPAVSHAPKFIKRSNSSGGISG